MIAPRLPLLLLPILGSIALADGPDIRFADFEGETHAPWTVEGKAFGPGPAAGTLPNQMHVSEYEGKRLASSFHGGDGSTGTLTSPPFRIERKFIRFLIGGGAHEGKTCVNLVVDGRVVRDAVGPNSAPGGSEALQPASWDVTEFLGRTAQIQAVDRETGGWGHVSLDAVVFSDRKPVELVAALDRRIVVDRRYLLFPIKHGARKRNLEILVDDQLDHAIEIELADGKPDWWASLDVSSRKGKRVTLRLVRVPEDYRGLDAIVQADEIPDAETIGREPLRPQFHFSPRRGWTNDPNGLVFFNGTYHLFFQHNPYGWNWGNMHWGHAVSKDLVHWEEVGDALYPDKFGPMFSGSGVVDRNNTSGLGRDGTPPLLFFYTAAGNPTVQCLAYSTDGGKTIRKYDKNPIVEQFTPGNRDPKVFFHEPSGKWIMALYVEAPREAGKPTRHTIRFLSSSDAKSWRTESEIDGFYECPDFFRLPIEGQPGRSAWVLSAADSGYMVGSFDGKEFKPETAKIPGQRGTGYYAAQTYSDIPASDGRRIQIGWLQAASPGMPFNQCMSLPASLALRSTKDGPRLAYRPIKELDRLRAESRSGTGLELPPGSQRSVGDAPWELVELVVDVAVDPDTLLKFDARGVPIVFDARAGTISVNGKTAPVASRDGRLNFRAFVDRTSVELFADDGLTYVPMPVIPKTENRAVSVSTRKGTARFKELTIHRLKSIWER